MPNTDPVEKIPWNPIDIPIILIWYFFAPKKLDAYREKHSTNDVYKVSSIPIATFTWFPIAIIAMATFLGIFTFPNRPQLMMNLLVGGVVIGWILHMIVGFIEPPVEKSGSTLSSLLLLVIGFLLLVTIVIVSYTAMRFIYLTLNELEIVGWMIVLSLWLSLSIALAISLEFTNAFGILIPVISAIFLGIFVPSALGARTLSIRSWLLIIMVCIFLLVGPTLLINKLLSEKSTRRFFRPLSIFVVIASNVILFWLVLLNGWYILS